MTTPLRVLILEDRAADAQLMVRELRQFGYDVDWKRVATGEEYAQSLDPSLDVILADYSLPQFDAPRALTILRERQCGVPLIVVTGTVGEEAAVECLKLGAADYLLKDRLARLGRAVEAAIGLRHANEHKQRAAEALEESNRRLQAALDQLRETQERIIQQERLRALGEMASGIAHDFNNLLAMIAGCSELPLLRPSDFDDRNKMQGYMELINSAAMDATSIVGRLRDFYRPREVDETFETIDLNRLIEQVIPLTEPRWKSQALARGVAIDVRTDLHPIPSISGKEPDLREALTNVIFNAVDAMPLGGTITIGTRVAKNGVVLDVRDSGTGMSEEVRRRCLEPFFTTKGRNGSGLGLAMVYGVIQRHGGTIDIESHLDRGTTFHFHFPLRRQTDLADSPTPVLAVTSSRRILVVEDEAPLRQILAAYLAVDHHIVETAVGGFDGLAKFQASPFDVVVTDRAMPDMSGDELARLMKQLVPGQPIILLTGFGEMMLADGTQPEAVDLVTPKPVTIAGLRDAISFVLRPSAT